MQTEKHPIMKAFRQIDLKNEKIYIWSVAILLSLVCLVFVAKPLHAMNLKTDNSISKSEVFVLEDQLQDLNSINNIINKLETPFESDKIVSSFIDSINLETKKNDTSDISAFMIPILFSDRYRHSFNWAWNPIDSSAYPKRILCKSLNEKPSK